MTNILFDVVDVLGEAEPGDSVVVWPPHVVATDDGKVKNTRPQTIRVDDGPVTVDLDPGPLWVQLQCGDRADTDPKLVRIPDLDEFDFVVTLRFLLDKVFVYDKVLESWAYENAERAEQAALDAIAARDRSISESELSQDAAAVSVAAALGFEGHSPEQVIDAAARAEGARDEVVPLADQVRTDATATAAHRNHVDGQVEAIDTAFTESVPPYLQPAALEVGAARAMSAVSVVEFGARPSPFNSTQAFKDTIAAAEQSGAAVYVPKGTWSVEPDAIVLNPGQKMYGAGALQTTISCLGERAGTGIELKYGCELSDMFIRGYTVGVLTNGYWLRVHDLKLAYNTVGLKAESLSYICKVYNNEIVFNRGIGVMIGGESYQFDLHHNIIDNNRGIGVLLHSTSGGVIVSDNTIEGNRDYSTGFGCGMYVVGANLSRMVIEKNWFEANGNDPDSVDVYFSARSSAPYRNIGDRILSELVPSDMLIEGLDRQTGTGAIAIHKNAFIFTRNGLALSMGNNSRASVRDNSFKGRLDTMNRHILLNLDPSTVFGNRMVIDIANNGYNNTDNAAGINPQVTTGVGGTIVHAQYAKPDEKGITYDGAPLYEKTYTISELLSRFPFTSTKNFGTGAAAEPARKLNADTPVDGYTASGNTEIVGTTSSAGELLSYGGRKIIIVAEQGSRVRLQKTNTWTVLRPHERYRKLRIIQLPPADEMVRGTLYANVGATVYGWIVIPVEDEYLFNGIEEVTVTDWSTESLELSP